MRKERRGIAFETVAGMGGGGYRRNTHQLFVSVGVRRDCSSVNTLAPCGGSLFSITSESAGESDSGIHDVVVGISTRLQVNSDISDKLAMWLSLDDMINTVPTRGPGTVECTRHASLGDGEDRVDEGKLVVTRKPQKRDSVAVTHPGVPAICPNYFTAPLSYSYTSSSVSIY